MMLLPLTAWSHHGWGWATDEEFEITGEIVEVRLGNPHGEVTIETGDERWIVEVGQPWRNDRAGLTESILSEGVTLKAHGHRSAKEGVLVVKAERVVINGKNYDLYPERES